MRVTCLQEGWYPAPWVERLTAARPSLDFGPGWRVYFTQRSNTLVVLLCGGDKSSQDRDIELALHLA
jgi:putative addiction module killer protein